MAFIREKLLVKGNRGSEELDVLFDSGAKRTSILRENAERLCDILYYEIPRKVTLADGKTTVNAIGTCAFETSIDEKPIEDVMEVLDIPKGNNAEMLIRASTLQRFKLKLRFSEEIGGDYVDTSEYDSASYLF
jgi:hypothetical protein